MAMTLIQSQTASNSASISFTSGIDSTYKLYIFKFYDVNPVTDAAELSFQVNATDTADYDDILLFSTCFYASHGSDDSTALTHTPTHGLPKEEGTHTATYQEIIWNTGNAADQSGAATMYLFDPSNTTYKKHWFTEATVHRNNTSHTTMHQFVDGHIDDATAIDDIQFKMSSGNMDAVIKMYGVG